MVLHQGRFLISSLLVRSVSTYLIGFSCGFVGVTDGFAKWYGLSLLAFLPCRCCKEKRSLLLPIQREIYEQASAFATPSCRAILGGNFALIS